jgi:tetratricopeptide (TPR) repeat protein
MLGFGSSPASDNLTPLDRENHDKGQVQKLPIESELRGLYAKAAAAFAEERTIEAIDAFLELSRRIDRYGSKKEKDAAIYEASYPPWLKRLGYLSAWGLGQLYERRNEFELAFQSYSKAIRFQRRAVLVWLKAAAMACAAGHYGASRFALERAGRLARVSKGSLPVWRCMLQSLRQQLDTLLEHPPTVIDSDRDIGNCPDGAPDEKRIRLDRELQRASQPSYSLEIQRHEHEGALLVAILENVSRMLEEHQKADATFPMLAINVTINGAYADQSGLDACDSPAEKHAPKLYGQEAVKRLACDQVIASDAIRNGGTTLDGTRETRASLSTLEPEMPNLRQGTGRWSRAETVVVLQDNQEHNDEGRNQDEMETACQDPEQNLSVRSTMSSSASAAQSVEGASTIRDQTKTGGERLSASSGQIKETCLAPCPKEQEQLITDEAERNKLDPTVAGSTGRETEDENESPARRTRRSRRLEGDVSQQTLSEQSTAEATGACTALSAAEDDATMRLSQRCGTSAERAAADRAMQEIQSQLEEALAYEREATSTSPATEKAAAVARIAATGSFDWQTLLLNLKENVRNHYFRRQESIALSRLMTMVLADTLDSAALIPWNSRAAVASMTCKLYRFWQSAHTMHGNSQLLGPMETVTTDNNQLSAWLLWTRRRLTLLEYALWAREWSMADECLRSMRRWLVQLLYREHNLWNVLIPALTRFSFLSALRYLQTQKNWSAAAAWLRIAVRLFEADNSTEESWSSEAATLAGRPNATREPSESWCPRRKQRQPKEKNLERVSAEFTAHSKSSNPLKAELEASSTLFRQRKDLLHAILQIGDAQKGSVETIPTVCALSSVPADARKTKRTERDSADTGDPASVATWAYNTRHHKTARLEHKGVSNAFQSPGRERRSANSVEKSTRCPHDNEMDLSPIDGWSADGTNCRKDQISATKEGKPVTNAVEDKNQLISMDPDWKEEASGWMKEVDLLRYSWFAGASLDSIHEDAFPIDEACLLLRKSQIEQWLQFAEFHRLLEQLRDSDMETLDPSEVWPRLLPYIDLPIQSIQAQLRRLLSRYEGGDALVSAQELLQLVLQRQAPAQASDIVTVSDETRGENAASGAAQRPVSLWNRLSELAHDLRRALTVLIAKQKPETEALFQKLVQMLREALPKILNLLFGPEPPAWVVSRSLHELLLVDWSAVFALYIIGREKVFGTAIVTSDRNAASVMPSSAFIHLLLHSLAAWYRRGGSTGQRRVPERTREAYATVTRLYAHKLWQPAEQSNLESWLAACPLCPPVWDSETFSRVDWEIMQCLQSLYGIDWTLIGLKCTLSDQCHGEEWLLFESLHLEAQPMETEALVPLLRLCRSALDDALGSRSRPRIRSLWHWTRKFGQELSMTRNADALAAYRDLVLYQYRFLIEYIDLEYKRVAEPERRTRVQPLELLEAVLRMIQQLWPFFSLSMEAADHEATEASHPDALPALNGTQTNAGHGTRDTTPAVREPVLPPLGRAFDHNGLVPQACSQMIPADSSTATIDAIGAQAVVSTAQPETFSGTVDITMPTAKGLPIDCSGSKGKISRRRKTDSNHPKTGSSKASDEGPQGSTATEEVLFDQASRLRARLDDPQLTLALAASLRHAAQLTLETAELIGDNNHFVLQRYTNGILGAFELAKAMISMTDDHAPELDKSGSLDPCESHQARWEALFCAYLLLPVHFPAAAWDTLPPRLRAALDGVRETIPALVNDLLVAIEHNTLSVTEATHTTVEPVLLLHYIAWLYRTGTAAGAPDSVSAEHMMTLIERYEQGLPRLHQQLHGQTHIQYSPWMEYELAGLATKLYHALALVPGSLSRHPSTDAFPDDCAQTDLNETLDRLFHMPSYRGAYLYALGVYCGRGDLRAAIAALAPLFRVDATSASRHGYFWLIWNHRYLLPPEHLSHAPILYDNHSFAYWQFRCFALYVRLLEIVGDYDGLLALERTLSRRMQRFSALDAECLALIVERNMLAFATGFRPVATASTVTMEEALQEHQLVRPVDLRLVWELYLDAELANDILQNAAPMLGMAKADWTGSAALVDASPWPLSTYDPVKLSVSCGEAVLDMAEQLCLAVWYPDDATEKSLEDMVHKCSKWFGRSV